MDNNGTMGDFFFEGFSSFNISEELIFVCISKIPVNFMELTRFFKSRFKKHFWGIFIHWTRGYLDTWTRQESRKTVEISKETREPKILGDSLHVKSCFFLDFLASNMENGTKIARVFV